MHDGISSHETVRRGLGLAKLSLGCGVIQYLGLGQGGIGMKNEQRLLKTWLHIGGLGLVGGLALALFVAQPASAALITFEDVVNGPFNNDIRTSATSDGFGFTSTHFHVINNPTQCAFGGCVANGTQYAAADAPTLAGPVTMTPSGGGTFSL